MSGERRREAIIKAAGRVFVEKGFHGTTTRELAAAAGVSEALLFKHFPSKEALYSAIQMACFKEEGAKIGPWLEALEPSTESLAALVHSLARDVLGGVPEESKRWFIRLLLRSLMDEGDFARVAVQGGPAHWVRKVEQCLEAARSAGDLIDEPAAPGLGGWFAHQLISGIMVHLLPAEPAIEFGVPREELVEQVVMFCLRGMGLTAEAIRRCRRSVGFDKR